MVFTVGHSVIEFGVRHWHPSFMVSCSFTVQVLSQLDLLRNLMVTEAYKIDFQLLPKELDVKVAYSTFQHPTRSSLRLLKNTQIRDLPRAIRTNSPLIELVWSIRGFCGVLRTLSLIHI